MLNQWWIDTSRAPKDTSPPLGVKIALWQPLTDDTDMAEALPAGDVALGYLGSSAGVVLNGRCAIFSGCQIKSGNRREVSRRLPSRGCSLFLETGISGSL
jgi:hypothetical protein